MACHWCLSSWSYHAGAETAPLVACEQKIRFKSVVLVYKLLPGCALLFRLLRIVTFT